MKNKYLNTKFINLMPIYFEKAQIKKTTPKEKNINFVSKPLCNMFEIKDYKIDKSK